MGWRVAILIASNAMKSRTLVFGALAAVALASSGCASPRLVRGITSRADHVKFMTYQGGETGVIKCRINADGTLADCKPMAVSLED